MRDGSAWEELGQQLESLQRHLAASRAANVSARRSREQAKTLVQLYFRRVRPDLDDLQLDEFAQIDRQFQDLLRLANGINRRSSYVRLVREIRSSTGKIEALREMAIGASIAGIPSQEPPWSEAEQRIVDTLASLVTSAANSYRQAHDDLAASARISYRGTAAELREAFREVLDHLAPDEPVLAQPNFKLEDDRTQPTMRQKVRFILKSRKRSKPSKETAEKTADLIDGLTASLVRSVYGSASQSTHVAPSKDEVRRVKNYVDSVLTDLLEI